MSNLWVQAAWSEPEEDWKNARPNKFGKSPEELYGNVHHVDEYFQGASTRPVPWKQQSRYKTVHDYDKDIVHSMLQDKNYPLTDVDPRILKASQPSIVRAAAQHYLTGEHEKTGETFEAGHNPGNAHPVVYVHHNGDHVLLSGHHRAAAALFEGRPLRAKVVHGGRPPR